MPRPPRAPADHLIWYATAALLLLTVVYNRIPAENEKQIWVLVGAAVAGLVGIGLMVRRGYGPLRAHIELQDERILKLEVANEAQAQTIAMQDEKIEKQSLQAAEIERRCLAAVSTAKADAEAAATAMMEEVRDLRERYETTKASVSALLDLGLAHERQKEVNRALRAKLDRVETDFGQRLSAIKMTVTEPIESITRWTIKDAAGDLGQWEKEVSFRVCQEGLTRVQEEPLRGPDDPAVEARIEDISLDVVKLERTNTGDLVPSPKPLSHRIVKSQGQGLGWFADLDAPMHLNEYYAKRSKAGRLIKCLTARHERVTLRNAPACEIVGILGGPREFEIHDEVWLVRRRHGKPEQVQRLPVTRNGVRWKVGFLVSVPFAGEAYSIHFTNLGAEAGDPEQEHPPPTPEEADYVSTPFASVLRFHGEGLADHVAGPALGPVP